MMSCRRRHACPSCLAVVAFCAVLASPASETRAQQETVHKGAGWLAYLSNWGIRGPWSIWFDTHYNTRSFFVLRGGATYRFEGGPSITAGYAHLWLDPGDGTLNRNEHRPWAQVFLPFQLSDTWSVSQRVRWDCRIQERVQNGNLVGGWATTQRLRFQLAGTYWLPPIAKGRLFVQIADEVLINLGRNAGPNYLDQNRASVMLGWRLESTQFRVGYMNRFVPGSTGQNPTDEHAALVWVNQDIWLPRDRRPPTKSPPAAEGENP